MIHELKMKGVAMTRLKLFRLSRSLSQWELARGVGISQGRYSMIERAFIKPTIEERERLAQILSVPASTLFHSAIRTRRQPEGQIVRQSEV
jgi:transcriptional regulator with XRE-family HTH domain